MGSSIARPLSTLKSQKFSSALRALKSPLSRPSPGRSAPLNLKNVLRRSAPLNLHSLVHRPAAQHPYISIFVLRRSAPLNLHSLLDCAGAPLNLHSLLDRP